MSNEQREAARAFRELGNTLVGLGRRLNVGDRVTAVGRQMRNVARGELADDNLAKLRRPVDELRAVVDDLAVAMDELRALFESLVEVVGVDN